MMEPVYPARLAVNDTDIELAIREGCMPMQRLLDPERDNLPYFGNAMSGPDPRNTHHPNFSMAHVPGRWLNALLNAEDCLGIAVDERVVRELAKWTYRAFSHPMGLSQSLDPDTFAPVPVSDLHNLRETTHALYALIKFRDDNQALRLVQRQIAAVDTYFDFKTGTWDEKGFNKETGGRTTCSCTRNVEPVTYPICFGRYIGPLVKLYKATGMEQALLQAIKLKDYAFAHVLNEQGDYDVVRFGSHTHSTTAMISSLAQLGEVLSDQSILGRVKAFMENGLRRIALDFGWCIENYYREDHYGEINNTADMMETWLILGKAGYPGCFQQAERILRAHLLPSQLLDTSFIPDWELPDEDFHHRLAARTKGAFGFPCPYGHEYERDGWISFNWDIVGGGVGGLCEAYRDKVTKTGGLVSVNLLFDHEDEDVAVQSPYSNNGLLTIFIKRHCALRVRLSDWVDRGALQVSAGGKQPAAAVSGEWLYLTELEQGQAVHLSMPLTISTRRYPFRADTFTLRWRGDAVEAADNMGRRLCFFRDLSDFDKEEESDEKRPV